MNALARYTDPEFFQVERREIFAHNWQIVGDLQAVAAPGDYVCANLAGFPVFAIRGERGQLQAFRNVCRHQQLPVLDNGVGHCEGRVRCRYHGWTYDLGGRCVLAPPQVRPDDFDTTTYQLDGVQLAEWSGLVAVNFAADPEPLSVALADFDVGNVPDGPVARGVVRVFANWKTIVDELVGGAHRVLPSVNTRMCGDKALTRKQDAEVWLFRGPTLHLHLTGKTVSAFQVVPRTFLKSEIHWYALGDADADASAAEQIGKAAELRQERIKAQKAGVPLEEDGVSALLDEVQAAVRDAPSQQG